MDLALRVDRLEAGLAELAAGLARLSEAQARTEEHVRALAAAQARTEEGLQRLTAAQLRTEERLDTLLQWQQGEAGRRVGERYERQIVQHAPNLFAGGYGGSPDAAGVQNRLTTLLAPQGPDGFVLDLASSGNVFAADLVWWKGERMAVVEISRVVDDHDVERAFRRAEALRSAGADVLPVVIGEAWADGETRAAAEAYRLVWKVGNEVSPGLIEFRRLPAPPPSIR